jgi:hypothetical protein
MEVFTQLDLNSISPLILKDIVTSLAAFVGMSLGIYNFWKERGKEKVKLRVIPKSVQQKGFNSLDNNPQDFFAIEVVNISRFTVTITEVGFLVSGTKQRISCSSPILDTQEKFPKKLEPRESLTAYVDLQSMLSSTNIRNVYCAFAKTSCDHIETGKTKALKQLIQYVRD